MKNMKIKHKLLALSGVLLFSLIFTGTISLVLMEELNTGTTVVSNNWLPSVILAEELNTYTSDFRITEASHVISQDDATMRMHEEFLEMISMEISDLFYIYDTELVTNEVDNALISEARTLWEYYLIIHSDMISFSKKNDTESAMFIMENESEQIFNEVSGVFLELVQFNKAGADQANLDGDAIYHNTIILVVLMMIVTIIVGFVCSTFIISSIVNPIEEVETAAKEILKGKLSTEINYTSNDEFGSLSNSMRNLCTMIKEVIHDIGYMLSGMAEGDYSVESQNADLYVGDFEGILGFTSNISTKLGEAIYKLQHRDILTGLYNRAGFSAWLEGVSDSKMSIKEQPKSMGVLSININGLKHINENSGLAWGDIHIKNSTKLLQEHFDYEFFRMSGDEFLGIALDVEKEDFENKVNALYEQMKNDKNYDFSIGHAWGIGGDKLSNLKFEAEAIMYINKQEYYNHSQRNYKDVNDKTLSDLLSYIENDEFMIYLQPQVRLDNSSLYGAEALIRRFDKTAQKMVFPDQFIPMYEQKSIIRHVDIFVVEEVCKLLSNWAKEGKGGKAIPISVNLSRVTLQEYGIVDTIVSICNKYNVPHKLLVIEVTERVGLIENNVASALITSFKDNGFNISLDDFGCAYSNIITLAQIEVDEVKIDKSLVDDLTTSRKNYVLVKNMIAMCNELKGSSTLAEGIEDEEQAKLLHELGCHLGQGYFYSRPIPVDEFYKNYIKS